MSEVLAIPIQGSEEEIEIPVEDLPEDAGEIIDILTEESAPPQTWTSFAVAYYRRGKKENFQRILKLTATTLQQDDDMGAQIKRIEVLNALAGFQLSEARLAKTDSRKGKTDREEALSQAISYINQASQIASDTNGLDETASAAGTWVVRGELQLMQAQEKGGGEGDTMVGAAKLSFQNALVTWDGYIPALLAKARLAFNEGDYKGALKLYCDTLKAKSDCPATVRLGIGVCYYRLKKPELAKKAFMRVLQMGPRESPNVDALMGLAILELNEKRDDPEEAIKRAVSYAKTAYELGEVGQTNPKVLNYLANHFFFTKNYSRTEELAISGFHHTASEAIKAESCYCIARAYHVKGVYERAMQFYQEAVKRAKEGQYTREGIGVDYVLPHFGLGQMYLWREQYDNAIASFEEVIKSAPDDYDTLKVLGWLYAKQGQTETGEWSEYTKKGVERLRRATAMRGDDPEVRLELAQLLQTDSGQAHTTEALEHYRAAMTVMRRRQQDIRPEVHSNVAVLYHRIGKFSRAEKSMIKALSVEEEGVDNAFPEFFKQEEGSESATQGTAATDNVVADLEPTMAVTANQVTAAYNLGLVYEALSRWGRAQFLYRSILKAFPGYSDAWLRLAVLARDSSQIGVAKQYFAEAAKQSPKSVDAVVLAGAMHLKLEKLGDAQKVFEKVVQKMDDKDVYSHVALGNIYFTVAADAAKFKSRDENTNEKETKNQNYAMQNYRRGFDLSKKRSIHGANGVGMVLAEQGFLDEAKTIFQRVRESTEDFPDGWTNLAHMYVAEKEYFQAIKLYEKCHKKFYGNADVSLLQYIARAYYDWAREQQDKGELETAAEKMRDCQRHVEKSLHLDPSHHISWFNLAVAKLQAASYVIKQAEPSEADVRQAIGELEQAKKLFAALGEHSCSEKELGFKKAKAVENVNSCDNKSNDAAVSPPCAVCCTRVQAAHDVLSQAALERAIERAGKLKSEADARTEAMERMKALEAERAAQAQKAKDDAAAAKAEMVRVQKEKRQRVRRICAFHVAAKVLRALTAQRVGGRFWTPWPPNRCRRRARSPRPPRRRERKGTTILTTFWMMTPRCRSMTARRRSGTSRRTSRQVRICLARTRTRMTTRRPAGPRARRPRRQR